MVSMEECYKEIVGKKPNAETDTRVLVCEILDVIKTEPKNVNKQFANLFFVDLFGSGWPSFCPINQSEAVMHEVIATVQVYALAHGCTDVDRMSITRILEWIIRNIPIN